MEDGGLQDEKISPQNSTTRTRGWTGMAGGLMRTWVTAVLKNIASSLRASKLNSQNAAGVGRDELLSETVVFLGPSLARTRARALLDIDYRPPIKRGDLTGMLGDPPRFIGIIDGEFFQSLSVSTKEILPLLEAGVTVLGASSMGALRAMELERYGMIGIGRIFQQFHIGAIDADDEVAVTYCPETYVTSSVPLVNYRIALADACKAGLVSAAGSKRLIGSMQRLYFPDRTDRKFWLEAEAALSGEEFCAMREYFERERPDAKAADAVELLETVRDCLATLHAQAPLAVR